MYIIQYTSYIRVWFSNSQHHMHTFGLSFHSFQILFGPCRFIIHFCCSVRKKKKEIKKKTHNKFVVFFLCVLNWSLRAKEFP